MRFPVKGWSAKIVNGIFEEPKNQTIQFAFVGKLNLKTFGIFENKCI